MEVATLCYLIRHSVHLGGRGLVCLARKKQKIGAGLWNGYGGHVERDETPLDAARRELREEGKVTLVNGREVACVYFSERSPQTTYRDLVNYDAQFRVHIFVGESEFGKEPEETEEMGPPMWYEFDKIPYHEMLPADRFILPIIFADNSRSLFFESEMYYGPEKKEVEWVVIRPFK